MRKLKLILTALAIALIVNSDGVFDLASANYISGSLNSVRIVAIFTITAATIWVLCAKRMAIPKKAANVLAVAVLTSTVMTIYAAKGRLSIGLYDIVCVVTYFMILSLTYFDRLWDTTKWRAIAHYLILWNLVFLLVSALAGNHLDPLGRLSGFIPTSSIFGTATALLYIAYTKLGEHIRLSTLIASTAIIFFSGTRSALVQVLGTLVLLINLKRRNAVLRYSFLIGLVAAVPTTIYTMDIAFDQFRILDIKDLEAGSAFTRLYWYRAAWDYLGYTSFLGGGGGGLSFDLTGGFLLHFDLLRLWVDYGVIVFASILLTTVIVARGSSGRYWWIYFILAFLIPGFHNALQAPELLFLSAFVIAARKPSWTKL